MDKILYRTIRSLSCGEINRFKLQYSPPTPSSPTPNLWVKIRNNHSIALRAAYLAGPYVLYVDCRRDDYDHNKKVFVTADQPVFEPQLLPGQSFYVELSCHTLEDSYQWTLDVVSQILFNNTIAVEFELMIGTSKAILQDTSFPEKAVTNADQLGLFVPNSLLHVDVQDTLDLWNLPVPSEKPIHLVIVTHGLHSNVTADMLYLKEAIDNGANDNVVVKGFFGNKGKTERGIKYLGSRVAEYVVDLVTNNSVLSNGRVTKISFVGHSLGGLIQTFAIAYLQANFPWFFTKIQPVNFVAIASPLLGVVNENPLYVKIALMAGVVGLTGQDLGLKYIENGGKPLLLLLPTGPTHQVLKRFLRRTVYANAVNDGVVPLRTSSLLFFDYEGLSSLVYAQDAQKKDQSFTESYFGPGTDGRFSAMSALLSYFLPQKQAKHKENDYRLLPRSSVLETAASLILPPQPSLKYITDPEARENVILHDKIYHDTNLPSVPPQELPENLGLSKKFLDSIDSDTRHLEEAIALEYHRNMSWRKVIVKLKPDAHNNIIVRRRFANAYGWPVIDHLVREHFSCEGSADSASATTASTDTLDGEADLREIITRDLISKQNSEIDKNQGDEDPVDNNIAEWIKAGNVDPESFFAVGVTGMLGDVSEIVTNFKDQCLNYGVKMGYKEKEENPMGDYT